jgi:hypothetical protein
LPVWGPLGCCGATRWWDAVHAMCVPCHVTECGAVETWVGWRLLAQSAPRVWRLRLRPCPDTHTSPAQTCPKACLAACRLDAQPTRANKRKGCACSAQTTGSCSYGRTPRAPYSPRVTQRPQHALSQKPASPDDGVGLVGLRQPRGQAPILLQVVQRCRQQRPADTRTIHRHRHAGRARRHAHVRQHPGRWRCMRRLADRGCRTGCQGSGRQDVPRAAKQAGMPACCCARASVRSCAGTARARPALGPPAM